MKGRTDCLFQEEWAPSNAGLSVFGKEGRNAVKWGAGGSADVHHTCGQRVGHLRAFLQRRGLMSRGEPRAKSSGRLWDHCVVRESLLLLDGPRNRVDTGSIESKGGSTLGSVLVTWQNKTGYERRGEKWMLHHFDRNPSS